MIGERHTKLAAVHLILEQDNKILLLRRFNTGFQDGNYSVVAGHIDSEESANQAMIREAKEEAGILIQPEHLQTIHVMHRQGNDTERIDFFIQAQKWVGEPINLEEHKCDHLDWFEINKLPENMVPYIASAINHIKEKKFYSEFGW